MADSAPIEHPYSWPVRRLGEFSLKIGSGATPIGGEASYLARRARWALVRSQNVFDRHFSEDGLAYISDEQAERLSGVRIQPRDILLNITGDGITFGRACEAPESILPAVVNQHVSIVRVDPKVADPGFVLAYLSHPHIKHYIESFNAGGSRRAITKGHIESFQVPLPPLPEQRAIAHILGTLDDKIELNRRMNETLEAIARAIFHSWFVDFDPVRARRGDPCGRPREGRDKPCPYMTPEILSLFPDSFEDSELGEIPAGWRVDSLGNLIELQYGKALRQEDRRLGDVAVFGSNGQVGWHDERLVEGPGIVVGRKGNPGVVTWVPTDFFPIDTTFYVVPKGECRSLHFLFYALKTHDLALLGADSAVPGLNRNLAYMSQQIVPSRLILETFDSLVQPLYQRIYQAEDESRTLAALRDTLLPKLLSGEIRVKEAERILERHM